MFTWICPQCGREVPPAYNDCPDCSKKSRPGRRRSACRRPPAAPAGVRAATAAARSRSSRTTSSRHSRRSSRRIIRRRRKPQPPRNRTIRHSRRRRRRSSLRAGYYAAPAARARNESAGVADDDPLRAGHRRRGLRHHLAGVHQSRFGRQRTGAHRQRGESGGEARRQDQPAAEIYRNLRRALRGGCQEEDAWRSSSSSTTPRRISAAWPATSPSGAAPRNPRKTRRELSPSPPTWRRWNPRK